MSRRILPDCCWCATLFNKIDWLGRKRFAATKKGPSKTMHIGRLGARRMGKTMFRSTQFRFAVIALFAVAAIPLTTASAGAFNQENLGGGGGGNSTFADPDEQVNHFGQGVRPFGSNGPVVQFGGQQGQLTPFGRFQGNGFNSPPPPDPYSRPLGNGN